MKPAPLYIILVALVSLLMMPDKVRAQRTDTSGILAANAKLKEIFSGGETFLEGPTMSPNELLYFSDIPLTNGKPGKAGIIWILNPLTGKSNVFRSPSGMSNGLMFDANGDLIVCEGADFGGRRVTKTDMKTGKSLIIAGLYQGKPFNAPNDLAIDEQGRIYFTDPRYIGQEPVEQFVMGVYRIDRDSSIHLVAANVTKPNGIIISADQKTLYVVNADFPGNGNLRFLPDDFTAVRPTPEGSLMVYHLMPDGSLRFKSKIEHIRGDGMTIDVEGNLYIAAGEKVEVFSSDGKKITEIKTPQATNLCFGRGRFSKTLFIAGGRSIYTIETKKEGYNIPIKK